MGQIMVYIHLEGIVCDGKIVSWSRANLGRPKGAKLRALCSFKAAGLQKKLPQYSFLQLDSSLKGPDNRFADFRLDFLF